MDTTLHRSLQISTNGHCATQWKFPIQFIVSFISKDEGKGYQQAYDCSIIVVIIFRAKGKQAMPGTNTVWLQEIYLTSKMRLVHATGGCIIRSKHCTASKLEPTTMLYVNMLVSIP